jgi:hypothetical protein
MLAIKPLYVCDNAVCRLQSWIDVYQFAVLCKPSCYMVAHCLLPSCSYYVVIMHRRNGQKWAAIRHPGDAGEPLPVVEPDGHMPELPGKERSAHRATYIGRQGRGGGVEVSDAPAVRNVPADAGYNQVAPRSAVD